MKGTLEFLWLFVIMLLLGFMCHEMGESNAERKSELKIENAYLQGYYDCRVGADNESGWIKFKNKSEDKK